MNMKNKSKEERELIYNRWVANFCFFSCGVVAMAASYNFQVRYFQRAIASLVFLFIFASCAFAFDFLSKEDNYGKSRNNDYADKE